MIIKDDSNTIILRQIIEKEGSVSMNSFMRYALISDDYGYYITNQPFGTSGDFITSPEISQIFGELIGIWAAHHWKQMDSKDKISIVELGPGRGTLMEDLVRATTNIKGFHESISIHLIEASPLLKDIQQKTLNHIKNIKIYWHKDLSDLPSQPSIIIANEFMDALPINQYIKIKDYWHEIMVSIAQGTNDFCTIEMPVHYNINESLNIEHPNAKHMSVIEMCPDAIDYIQKISDLISLNTGVALIIDYGYDYQPSSRIYYNSTLQAVKNHKYHPILSDFGQADISSHVDFFALKNAAMARFCNVFGSISQKKFLENIGIKLRASLLMKNATYTQTEQISNAVERLISPDQMGTLFKAIAISSKNFNNIAGF